MHLNGGDAYDWTETKSDGWVFDYRANLPTAAPRHVRNCVDAAVAEAAALHYELIVDPRLQTLDPGEEPAAPHAEPLTSTESALESAADEAPASAPKGPGYGVEVAERTPRPAAGRHIPVRRDIQPMPGCASLAEIWNGRRIRELRHNIRENRVDPEICDGASCVYVTSGKR
jgi:hypothetical protein